MNIFLIIDKNASTNFSMSQIPLGFIVYKVVSASWTICYNFVEKWIYISKALLRVKCER